MFHAVEKYKILSRVILGIIAITFVGFGASTLATPGHDYIGKVGDYKISEADVNDELRRMQATGTQVTKDAVYQQLLQQAWLQQGAQDLGVAVSLEQIKRAIVNTPYFQDNGQFSEEKYKEFLQSNSLTEDLYVEQLRKQFALMSMVNLSQSGNLVSDTQAKQLLWLLKAPRQLRTITFSAEQYVPKVTVNDDQLQKFYKAHLSNYKMQQAVKFSYIELSAAQLGAKETVSDTELKEAYDRLSAEASDAKPSFDRVKNELIAEVRQRKGELALQKAKEKISDLAFNNPTSLTAVAHKMGLPIKKQEQWLTREDAKKISMPASLQQALFSDDVLIKKYNSEAVGVGNNTIMVVRADEVRQEHQAPFQEVKNKVKADYISTESHKLAMVAAQHALNDFQQGKTTASHWSSLQEITPDKAMTMMSKNDFKQWIKTKPSAQKPSYVLLKESGNPVLMEIQAIKPPADLEQQLPSVKNVLGQSNAQNNINTLLNWLSNIYPVKSGAQKIDMTE